jgi:integrase
LGDGRWRPRITTGYRTNKETGKREQIQQNFPIFEANSPKEAQKHLAALVAEVDAGEPIQPSNETVEEYFTRWLRDEIQPPATAVNTWKCFKFAIENHIIPALGFHRLQDLKRGHVKTFLRDKEQEKVKRRRDGRTLSRGTVRLLRDVLHTALDDALQADLIRRNPAALHDKQRRKRRRQAGVETNRQRPKVKAWTEQQQRSVIAAARALDDARRERFTVDSLQMSALVRFAFDTGMRLREVLGTKWSDFSPPPKEWTAVNLDTVTLTVRRQLANSNTNAVDNADRLDAGEDETDPLVAMFGVTKSAKERTINLTSDTVAALRTHYTNQQMFRMKNGTVYNNHGLVFAKEQGYRKETPGRPFPPTDLDHLFRQIVASAKVPAFSFHSCRHSCATTMLLKGVSPVVVAEHLGHATTAITLKVYAHCLPAAQHEAARVRERALRA